METIEAIAKKNKAGKYKIDLPIINDAPEPKVLVVVLDKAAPKKAKSKKTLADFAGKLEWKGDPVAYQKMMRDEWK